MRVSRLVRFLSIACVVGAALQPSCHREVHPPITVCLNIPESQQGSALRGIGFWGVQYTVVESGCDLTIQRGLPPPSAPFAQAYYLDSTIILVSGDVMCTVRHEFGHFLGYEDSPVPWGVMSDDACSVL